MPTLNAAPHLARSLAPLVPAVADGLVRELVIADGGSTDDTIAIANEVGARVTAAHGPRAVHLQAGAVMARSPWLLFLDAHTALDDGWSNDAARFVAQPLNETRAATFRFDLGDMSPAARATVLWMRMFATPTSAQGLLISRRLYDALGGYRDRARKADADLFRRIGRRRLRVLPSRAVSALRGGEIGGL